MPDIMTLTNGQLAQIVQGLSALDGIRLSREEFRPFKFDDNAETAWLIANNAAVATDALRAFERAKKMLAVQHGVADNMPINSETVPKITAFSSELEKLEERGVEVRGLSKIRREALNVAKNQIPPSVLAKLMPILE